MGTERALITYWCFVSDLNKELCKTSAAGYESAVRSCGCLCSHCLHFCKWLRACVLSSVRACLEINRKKLRCHSDRSNIVSRGVLFKGSLKHNRFHTAKIFVINIQIRHACSIPCLNHLPALNHQLHQGLLRWALRENFNKTWLPCHSWRGS